MNTKNKKVIIEKNLFSPASKYDFNIGKGAVSQLRLITEPMAEFLKYSYVKDTDCISGDIIALFELSKENFLENDQREMEHYNSPLSTKL